MTAHQARLWAARAALAVALVAGVAPMARAEVRHDDPCTGCMVDAARANRALLVVLHGDDTDARATLAEWRDAAEAAHVALFAPQCPHELGCAGSWWRWLETERHDEGWLGRQIDAVRSSLGVERVYLAGYSGGATYLSAWAPAHAQDFPVIALVSGGATMTDTCPTAKQSALLMVGNEDDMLAQFVRPFATWFTSCANTDVTWRIIPRLGHHAMHRALSSGRAREVIDWLLASHPPPAILVPRS